MVIPEKPIGGTELMYNELMSRLDPTLLDRYSIFNYISNADFNKRTIYWNQLSYDQDAVQFLNDEDLRNRIDYFVFVSHWQAEMFRKQFNIPGYKTWVIKNAALPIEKKNFENLGDKIKICYTSTPWRGLDVLLDAWEMIDTSNCELHVFSSTKIYGTDFHSTVNHRYQEIFDRAKSMSNVIYRDYTPNSQLRQELPTFDILAYPCSFEETSCISVIEALSAGLNVVCSNIGALPETTEGWADMYTIKVDRSLHAAKFSELLNKSITDARSEQTTNKLKAQVEVYRERWSWSRRVDDWVSFFNTIIVLEDQSDLTLQNQATQQISYANTEFDLEELDNEDVVIDIGAYVGTFSVKAITSGAGKVISYEPNPENFEQLRNSIGHIENTKINNLAVWSKDDLIISFTNDSSKSTGFTEESSLRVQTISLDSILKQHEKVRLIKITAEGGEYPILLSSTLLNRCEEIVAEIHLVSEGSGLKLPLSWRKECNLDQIVNHLKYSGFEVDLQQTENPEVVKLKAVNLSKYN
jgi:FkbM family methyltransferase